MPCRLCSKCDNLLNVFTLNSCQNLDLIIEEVTTIKINKEDKITNICSKCYYLVQRFYRFRQKCIACNKNLQHIEMAKEISSNNKLKEEPLSDHNDDETSLHNHMSLYAQSLAFRESFSDKQKKTRTYKKRSRDSDSDMDLMDLFSDDDDSENTKEVDSNIVNYSLNKIKEQYPNIRIPAKCINYNFDCKVVLTSFQQLLREAYYSPLSNNQPEKCISIDQHSIPDTSLERDLYANSKTSLDKYSSNMSICSEDSISAVQHNFKCNYCQRRFQNEKYLQYHVISCHEDNNGEAKILVEELRITKQFKTKKLSNISLCDNGARIVLEYKNLTKVLSVPRTFNADADIRNSKKTSLTYKTLNLHDSDALLTKVMTDSLPEVKIENVPKIHNLQSTAPIKTTYNYEEHRNRMLKETVLNQVEENNLEHNVNSGICQEYLPSNSRNISENLNIIKKNEIDSNKKYLLSINRQISDNLKVQNAAPYSVTKNNEFELSNVNSNLDDCEITNSEDIIDLSEETEDFKDLSMETTYFKNNVSKDCTDLSTKTTNNLKRKAVNSITNTSKRKKKNEVLTDETDFFEMIFASKSQINELIKNQQELLNKFENRSGKFLQNILHASLLSYFKNNAYSIGKLEQLVQLIDIPLRYQVKCKSAFRYNLAKKLNNNKIDKKKFDIDWQTTPIINIAHIKDKLINISHNGHSELKPDSKYKPFKIPVLNWRDNLSNSCIRKSVATKSTTLNKIPLPRKSVNPVHFKPNTKIEHYTIHVKPNISKKVTDLHTSLKSMQATSGSSTSNVDNRLAFPNQIEVPNIAGIASVSSLTPSTATNLPLQITSVVSLNEEYNSYLSPPSNSYSTIQQNSNLSVSNTSDLPNVLDNNTPLFQIEIVDSQSENINQDKSNDKQSAKLSILSPAAINRMHLFKRPE